MCISVMTQVMNHESLTMTLLGRNLGRRLEDLTLLNIPHLIDPHCLRKLGGFILHRWPGPKGAPRQRDDTRGMKQLEVSGELQLAKSQGDDGFRS